jgi:hypothetical protein
MEPAIATCIFFVNFSTFKGISECSDLWKSLAARLASRNGSQDSVAPCNRAATNGAEQ